MTLRDLFHYRERRSHLRMYEFSVEYLSQTGDNEITFAYVAALSEEYALIKLKEYLTNEGKKFIQLIEAPTMIELSDFDERIHSKWPEFIDVLVASKEIRAQDENVYLLPPIEINVNDKKPI